VFRRYLPIFWSLWSSWVWLGQVLGIGQALIEATSTDRQTARILNPGLNEYLVPAHADVPLIDVAFIEERDENINVLGVKGIGELPVSGVAPAIANAVHHATGRRSAISRFAPRCCYDSAPSRWRLVEFRGLGADRAAD
jgi:hypothetical protein